MEGSKRLVVYGLFALLLLALVADANAQCSVNQLTPCQSAAFGGWPSQACCSLLRSVNFNCFCSLVSRGNYPRNIINNAIRVPQKCGQQVYAMYRGRTCAGYRIP